mmetsp:Transcript_17656/g.29834  ORF Transcript_17656/g.29834 Transcript_17656/m.29834 type:complete len:87 (+) Transcript_17656:550-810(+)
MASMGQPLEQAKPVSKEQWHPNHHLAGKEAGASEKQMRSERRKAYDAELRKKRHKKLFGDDTRTSISPEKPLTSQGPSTRPRASAY